MYLNYRIKRIKLLFKNTYGYLMPSIRSIDIDNLADFLSWNKL